MRVISEWLVLRFTISFSYFLINRISCHRYSVKKAVYKNFAIFTGKHLRWCLFLIKLLAWRPEILSKRDSDAKDFEKCFPMNIVLCLITPILKKHLKRVLRFQNELFMFHWCSIFYCTGQYLSRNFFYIFFVML